MNDRRSFYRFIIFLLAGLASSVYITGTIFNERAGCFQNCPEFGVYMGQYVLLWCLLVVSVICTIISLLMTKQVFPERNAVFRIISSILLAGLILLMIYNVTEMLNLPLILQEEFDFEAAG